METDFRVQTLAIDQTASGMIDGVRLVDPDSEAVLENATFSWKKGKIDYAGPTCSEQIKRAQLEGLPVIERPGFSIIPSIVDSHVHLSRPAGETRDRPSLAQRMERAAHNLKLAAGEGVTAVRDCGDWDFALAEIRDRERAREGMDLRVAGKVITTSRGHLNWFGLIAEGKEALQNAARTILASGADLIKVCATGGGLTEESHKGLAQYTAEELTFLKEEAAKEGKIVAAHAHGTAGIKACVEAGIGSIEHASFVGADPRTVAFDESLIEKMGKKGIFMVGTILRLMYLGPNATEEERKIIDSYRGYHRFMSLIYRRAHKHGVPFVLATDADLPENEFGNFHLMLKSAVKDFGFTYRQVLQSVTSTARRLLGLAANNLRVGQSADFALLQGNPLDDHNAYAAVQLTVKSGRVLYPRTM